MKPRVFLFVPARDAHAWIGHTLLEMTIAMALGLIVTASAVSLYHSQRIAFTQSADTAQINDAAMTALTLIGEQLQMAGFVPADMPASFVSRPALFGCSGGRPVGADDTLTCESLATHSDGVAVRYVADGVSTWLSTAGLATDCLGQGVTKADADAPGVAIVNRFYAKTSGATGEPELYCEGSGKANSSQPLVEGVERVRLRYWLTGGTSAVDAAALAPAQWASVVAVDVCVLVRGAPQTAPTRYVDCDGVSTIGSDARVRRAFWRRVAIRNSEVSTT
ncbi:PilW family protein [Paraburkholderia sp. C35]|uniref:PilW family protein n=1 Tax=Paraburkholderia sp. C35 TaxID=2126993 RepID=UPI000D693363|nr:PilW family protein [Paraburkholderia sp. C35]